MIPSRVTAMRCAELVQQAYDTNAPRPLVAPIDGGIVLAFAGSRCARDFELDAMAWHDDAGMHAGFRIATDECTDGIIDAVAKLWRWTGSPRVVLTGHSLGAAIALIAACGLSGARSGIEAVTFGTPRVGGGLWHRHYRAKAIPTLRIYRDWDPVASAPAWWGWRHVGESLHLTRQGTPIADPTTPLGKLRRLLAWHVGDLDHSMPGYVAALAWHARRGFEWPR